MNNTTIMAFAAGVISTAGLLLSLPDPTIQNALGTEMKQKSAEPQEWSPTKPYPRHSVYYPGTEELKPHEMRVIACGTGMPQPRLKQAAA